MPVSEVRPGMTGYALTVFKGTTITKFHIKVLGILSKFNEGKDYILFRALDGPSVTRHPEHRAWHERQPDLYQRAFSRSHFDGHPRHTVCP